jgi:hypothetical protein
MRLLLSRRRATLEKRDIVTGKDGTPRVKVTGRLPDPPSRPLLADSEVPSQMASHIVIACQ